MSNDRNKKHADIVYGFTANQPDHVAKTLSDHRMRTISAENIGFDTEEERLNLTMLRFTSFTSNCMAQIADGLANVLGCPPMIVSQVMTAGLAQMLGGTHYLIERDEGADLLEPYRKEGMSDAEAFENMLRSLAECLDLNYRAGFDGQVQAHAAMDALKQQKKREGR